jgi:hypothetical protein
MNETRLDNSYNYKKDLFLGNKFLSKGELDDAIVIYEKILERDPDCLDAKLQKMKAYQRKGLFLPSFYLVDRDRKIIFCRIPKNANSLFTYMMLDLSKYREDYERSNLTFSQYISQNKQNFFLKDLNNLNEREYFKFAILRNPFKRLVSGYLDRFVKRPVNINSQPAIENVYNFLGMEIDLKRSITFSQFVHYLARTEDKDLDLHWRPQVNFLGLGLFEFDFIGQFEELNSIIQFLENKLEITIKTEVSNKVHITNYANFNSGEQFHDFYPHELNQLEGLPKSQNLYTPELENLVRQRYANDIKIYEEKFGSPTL